MDDLYRANILDHFRNPRNKGTLPDPDASFEDFSPTCGDRIRVDLRFDDGQISIMTFDGTGCAISQAAVSILTEIVPGMTVAQVKALGKEDILDELGITPTSSRLKCALLGLKVLKIAVAGKQWHDDLDDL